MYKEFVGEKFVDRNGLIVQLDGDGGDTCQRIAFIEIALIELTYFDSARYSIALDLLEPETGRLWRNPYPPHMWWADRYNQSRDQTLGHYIVMSEYGFKGRLKKHTWSILSRLGFFWNYRHIGEQTGWKIPDILFPQHYGVLIRANEWSLLYPVLLLTDLGLLLSVVFRVIGSHLDHDSVDDLNLCELHWQARRKASTPISWLARKFHKLRYRGLSWAFHHYFRAETKAPTRLAELWDNILDGF